MERTLIILKPDAVQRSLVGQIVERFERKGLKIIGMKRMQISPELAAQHYSEHQGKPFYDGLVQFMTSRPVVTMAFEGHEAISVCRKLMGAKFGWNDVAGTPGGAFGISNGFKLVDGSDSPEAAAKELELFFHPGELLEYDRIDDPWNAAE